MKTVLVAAAGTLMVLGLQAASANAAPGNNLGGIEAGKGGVVKIGYYDGDWRRDGYRPSWEGREARRWWWWKRHNERREAWRDRERYDDYRLYRDERRWR